MPGMIVRQGKASGHVKDEFIQENQDRFIAQSLFQSSACRGYTLKVVFSDELISGNATGKETDLPPRGVGLDPLPFDEMFIPGKGVRLLTDKGGHAHLLRFGESVDLIACKESGKLFSKSGSMHRGNKAMSLAAPEARFKAKDRCASFNSREPFSHVFDQQLQVLRWVSAGKEADRITVVIVSLLR